MLEILVMIRFCKSLAALARKKGRSTAWAAFGAIGWFSGELMGAFAGASQGVGTGGVYLCAILGGAVGSLVAYLLVASLDSHRADPLPVARVFD